MYTNVYVGSMRYMVCIQCIWGYREKMRGVYNEYGQYTEVIEGIYNVYGSIEKSYGVYEEYTEVHGMYTMYMGGIER